MTAPDAPPCYTVTRESMGDALASHPLTEHLTPERRERMADALLGMAGVPAVSPLVTEDQAREIMQATVAEGMRPVIDAELAKAEAVIRADERERIAQLAEERKARYPVTHLAEDGHLSMGSEPFAPLIREQS